MASQSSAGNRKLFLTFIPNESVGGGKNTPVTTVYTNAVKCECIVQLCCMTMIALPRLKVGKLVHGKNIDIEGIWHLFPTLSKSATSEYIVLSIIHSFIYLIIIYVIKIITIIKFY